MKRRQLLSGVGLGLVVTMAGCIDSVTEESGLDEESESDSEASSNSENNGDNTESNGGEVDNEPREVIEEYLDTFFGGNPSGFNEVRHSDSPVSEVDDDEELFDVDVTIDGIENIEESDERIVAQVTTTTDANGEVTVDREIELRTENNEWKFWHDSELE